MKPVFRESQGCVIVAAPTVAALLRLLTRSGWTVRQMADRCQVSPCVMRRWMSGRVCPSDQMDASLAGLFAISLDEAREVIGNSRASRGQRGAA